MKPINIIRKLNESEELSGTHSAKIYGDSSTDEYKNMINKFNDLNFKLSGYADGMSGEEIIVSGSRDSLERFALWVKENEPDCIFPTLTKLNGPSFLSFDDWYKGFKRRIKNVEENKNRKLELQQKRELEKQEQIDEGREFFKNVSEKIIGSYDDKHLKWSRGGYISDNFKIKDKKMSVDLSYFYDPSIDEWLSEGKKFHVTIISSLYDVENFLQTGEGFIGFSFETNKIDNVIQGIEKAIDYTSQIRSAENVQDVKTIVDRIPDLENQLSSE